MSDTPFIPPHVAIDDVLIAGQALRHWLKPGHPPWTASLAEGFAHYHPQGSEVERGNATFDLWNGCRTIERLRLAWTGQMGPAAETPPETPSTEGI